MKLVHHSASSIYRVVIASMIAKPAYDPTTHINHYLTRHSKRLHCLVPISYSPQQIEVFHREKLHWLVFARIVKVLEDCSHHEDPKRKAELAMIPYTVPFHTNGDQDASDQIASKIFYGCDKRSIPEKALPAAHIRY